jgi:hypothetical protein
MSQTEINLIQKYCPDCTAMMNSLSLVSSQEFPNEYRLMVYRCPKCTKENQVTKLFFLRKVDLKEDEKGKFSASRTYNEKLVVLVNTLHGYGIIHAEKAPTQYCIYCKAKLRYDAQASVTNNGEKPDIRSYFHFDCSDSKEDLIFTFIRSRIDNVELVRMIQG